MSTDEASKFPERNSKRIIKLPEFFKSRLRSEGLVVKGDLDECPRFLRCRKSDHDALLRFVLNCSKHIHVLNICRSYLSYSKELQDPLSYKNDWPDAKKNSARITFIRAEAKIRYGIIREQAYAVALNTLYGVEILESCIGSQFAVYSELLDSYVTARNLVLSPTLLDEWRLGIFKLNNREFIRWVESDRFPFSSPSQGLRAFSYEYFQCSIRSVKSRSKGGPPPHVYVGLLEGIKRKIEMMESLESDTRLLAVIKQDLGASAAEEVRRWAEQNTGLLRYQSIRNEALSHRPF